MHTYSIIGVALLTIANLNGSQGQNVQGNFWKSYLPGELLGRLDKMIIDDLKNPHFTKIDTSTAFPETVLRRSTSSKTVAKKSPSPLNKRSYATEDKSASSASTEADDYERNYERFVRNYFDDATNFYLSNDDENIESGEIENLSTDGSSEVDSTIPLDAVPYDSGNKSKKNQTKKCRKIRRKREICVICKNTRNGDRSEICSYKSGNEPENYAFETQRKYRKTRERNENESQDDEEEEESEERGPKSKDKKKNIRVGKKKI